MNGNAACAGHSECDAIIMDNACVTASPQLTANNIDANLIHEAAIGKIAGEQLIQADDTWTYRKKKRKNRLSMDFEIVI